MPRRTGLSLLVTLVFLVTVFYSPVCGSGREKVPPGHETALHAVDITIPPPGKGFFPFHGRISPGIPPVSESASREREALGFSSAGGEDLAWVIMEVAADTGTSGLENRLEALGRDIRSLGGRVDLTWENLVQAWLPVAMIEVVGEWPEVKEIREVSPVPYREAETGASSRRTDGPSSGDWAEDFISPGDPVDVHRESGSPGVTSEGAGLTGVFDWHDAGLTGSGVKVAVIDRGFKDYVSFLGKELPDSVVTKFYGDPSDTVRGTACAEIVHDMAPGAGLYLVRPRTEAELGEAVTWLIGQGVSIISCGLNYGLDAGPGDGTGFVNERIVSKAVEAGVTWVNGAGDLALSHWSGVFSDSDRDGIHNFSGPDEVNGLTVTGTGPVTVTMNWNDSWGTAENDYDLLIYEYESGVFVAGSQREQDGDEGPWENVTFSPAAGKNYGVVINRYRGGAATLHVSVLTGQGLKHARSSSSLPVPGDNPAALTTGAVSWNSPDELEVTSSRGPSINGAIKPDLVGPTGVSTVSHGSGGFRGTAAACAHAAGAAALLKQANPSWSPAQIKSELERNARDLGSPGKDSLYGSGLLKLAPPVNVHRLYFPHSATVRAWETEAGLVNLASATVQGVLRAYDHKGNAVSSELAVSLPPRGRRQLTVGSAFSNPDSIGYLVFLSASPDVTGYMNFYMAGTCRTSVPAVRESEVNTGNIAVPHIASSDLWSMGISLVNTSSASKTVTFDFGGGLRKTRTIGPRAHDAFFLRDLFGGPGSRPSNLESALITNAAGIIGYSFFATDDTLAGTALEDESAYGLYFPHIAVTKDWETCLVVQNLSSHSGTLTITSYDGNGTTLGSQNRSIPGRGKYLAASSAALPPGTAWCRVSADRPLAGSCFAVFRGTKFAAFTVTAKEGKSLTFPRLEKSGYTGIAFVNPGSGSASVTLKAYNDSGRVVATKYLTVGACSKKVDIADYFFDSSISGASWIGLTANRDLVGFQLNHTSDLKFLDALEGL